MSPLFTDVKTLTHRPGIWRQVSNMWLSPSVEVCYRVSLDELLVMLLNQKVPGVDVHSQIHRASPPPQTLRDVALNSHRTMCFLSQTLSNTDMNMDTDMDIVNNTNRDTDMDIDRDTGT